MKNGWVVSLCLLFSAAMMVQANDVKSKPTDSTSLTYQWQPHQKIGVVYEFTTDSRQNQSTIKGAYTMNTLPHAKGMEIKFTDMQNEVISEDAKFKGFMGAFLNTMLQHSPSYIINKSGELVELGNVQAYRSNVRAGLSDISQQLPAKRRSQVESMINAMTTEEQLMASISEEWGRMVGAWLDTEMEHGETYTSSHQAPIPMLGNLPVTMSSEFSLVGRVPCHAKAKANNCVKLTAYSYVGRDEGKKFIQALEQQFNMSVSKHSTFTITTEVEIITEPNTLYPHSITERKLTSVPTPKGIQEKSELKTYRFQY